MEMDSQEAEMVSRPFIKKPKPQKQKSIPATQIHGSGYVIWLVLFYSGLVLSSWTIICTITYHPIKGKHYNAWAPDFDDDSWGSSKNATELQAMYRRNERWYKAAQVIQSVVAVLTIPLTSAVCSSAAVVYLQCRTKAQPPTFKLRHMIVLADKGWTNIETYYRLITGQWSRYSSTFLLWAVILHVLGAIISPIHQIFLSTVNIKTPTAPSKIHDLLDIPDKFGNVPIYNLDTIPITRNSFVFTSGDDITSQLWIGDNNCANMSQSAMEEEATLCSPGGNTWGNLSMLPDPFFAQLPNSYNSGLVQQFLPRFNFTGHYESISEEQFPANYDTIPGALSINHSPPPINTTKLYLWAVHACMPSDQRVSPWEYTTSQQSFTEHLYLNVSFSKGMLDSLSTSVTSASFLLNSSFSEFFRVTLNTTAGYFELPNYMNGQKASSLLRDNPDTKCGSACTPQRPYQSSNDSWDLGRNTTSLVEDLAWVQNKGPLLTTALALFGPNSWIDLLTRYPDLYSERTIGNKTLLGDSKICLDFPPLSKILGRNALTSLDSSAQFFDITNQCINLHAQGTTVLTEIHAYQIAARWLSNFRAGSLIAESADPPDFPITDPNPTLSNAFTVAAYLANMAWMTDTKGRLTVSYDMGADSQKPSISGSGIITVSILIGFHLLGLLATAIYASWFPRWTGSLDAFSMVRLGSSIGDQVTLKLSSNDDELRMLDELPGWIGDDSDGKVGHVVLGGAVPLRRKRGYESYEGKAAQQYAHEQLKHRQGY